MSRSRTRRVSPRNFLAGLSPEHFEALRALMRPVELGDGELLCRQGELSDRAWFVDEGAVSLTIDLPGGGESEVAVARAGEILGELGLVTDSRRTANARARGALRLLEVERTDFRGLLSYFHPAALGVTRRLAMLMAERIHEAVRMVHALDGIGRPPHGEDDEPPPGSDAERGCDWDYRAFLPSLPFFEGWTERDRGALLDRVGEPWSLPRGRVLCPTGYRPRAAHLVLRGAVELKVGDATAARRLGVLGPGSVAGELPLLLDRRRLVQVEVREPSLVLELPAQTFTDLVADDDLVSFRMLAGVVRHLGARLEAVNHVVSRRRRERRTAGLGDTLHDPGTEGVTQLRRAEVLVIDDDPSTREPITALLRGARHRVEEATDADAGRARIRGGAEAFDAIVLAAALQHDVLGTDGAPDRTPVVVVGGPDSLEDAMEAIRAGAHDYLPRTAAPTDLSLEIDRLLERERLLG